MARASLAPRDRRALLLGALVLAPALFFIWAVKPYLAALESSRDFLSVERAALARERAAVTAAQRNPGMQQLADSLMRAMSPRLFAGRDDVMATAELVSHLGALAQANDVWLQNATTRPATVGTAGVRTLQVALRAESDLEGVVRFLRAIENGDKLLQVERLDVSVVQGALPDNGVEPVSISATILGFAIPGDAARDSVREGLRVAGGTAGGGTP
jgi:hypothetical protein